MMKVEFKVDIVLALELRSSGRAVLELLRVQWGSAPGVRYNLACYECLSGNLKEAKRLIDEEIASSSAARDQALKDDDLKAIHDYIREKAPIQTARNGEIS